MLTGKMLRMIFLNENERAQLRAQHKAERDGRARDRIKAVLLFDKGWSIPEVAEALLLSDDPIREHISEYREFKKLKPGNGGSNEKLSAQQSEQLKQHLQGHIYLYVKNIIAYVSAHWSIVYSVPGMRNWLKRHGFSYKKPALVPGKANKQQQQEWLSEYEKIKENLHKDETICFMDGVHPTHNVRPAYG